MQFDPLLNPIPVVDRQTRALGMAMGSCLAIRRALWNAAGGLPGFFGSIAEDMYLCLYVRMLGLRVACAATSGYRHRVGTSFGGGKVIANRLGWLPSIDLMKTVSADLKAFAEEIKAAGITHAVVLGMGGSSLAPEMFRAVFGSAAAQSGWPIWCATRCG